MVRDLSTNLQVPEDRLIKGCQIFIPETVFLKDGKFDFLVMQDKDLCLTLDTKIKLTSLNVKIRVQEAAKEKKEDVVEFGN
jgi:hypothetical protein